MIFLYAIGFHLKCRLGPLMARQAPKKEKEIQKKSSKIWNLGTQLAKAALISLAMLAQKAHENLDQCPRGAEDLKKRRFSPRLRRIWLIFFAPAARFLFVFS